MTYCVGILVDAGLVMIADTRTNAGIDNISMYKKLHVLADGDGAQVFAASSGSLSVTQSVMSMLAEGLPPLSEGEPPRTVAAQPTMFRVAQLVGEALTVARRNVQTAVAGTRVTANASLLLGGRVGSEPLRLFLVYQEGNFIECQADAPFLQVGELKYGKPILDRALTRDTPLAEALKLALLSFDSTMRSNLSVGRPLDLVALSSEPGSVAVSRRIEENDDYFRQLSEDWGRLLREAGDRIPDPPYLQVAADPEPERKPLAEQAAPVPKAA